jgi:hypothetical protein
MQSTFQAARDALAAATNLLHPSPEEVLQVSDSYAGAVLYYISFTAVLKDL